MEGRADLRGCWNLRCISSISGTDLHGDKAPWISVGLGSRFSIIPCKKDVLRGILGETIPATLCFTHGGHLKF